MDNAASAAPGHRHVTFGLCRANLCLPNPCSAGPLRWPLSSTACAAVRASLCGVLALAGLASAAPAEPTHAIAMHGKPAMADGFIALPYANPDAPKGGRLVEGVLGTFDSLNPMIVQGLPVQTIRGYVVESLMARSYDEPFTLYGLLARTIDTDDARSFVTFALDPAAHFSDGAPVTAEDVAFSWQLLRDHGRPNYRTYYAKVAKAEILDARTVRFDFAEAGDRELPLIIALMPVLPKHAVDAATFESSTLSKTDRQRPLRGRRRRCRQKRHLQARSELLGPRSADQSRPVEFRRAAVRFLSRRQRLFRSLQGRALRRAQRDRSRPLADRLRLSRRARRPRGQGFVRKRPAEICLRLRLQYAAADFCRHPREAGDRAVVRFQVGQSRPVLQSLSAQRELLRRFRIVRLSPAGGRARARAIGALPRRGAPRRARRHLVAAGRRRLRPRPRDFAAGARRCFAPRATSSTARCCAIAPRIVPSVSRSWSPARTKSGWR